MRIKRHIHTIFLLLSVHLVFADAHGQIKFYSQVSQPVVSLRQPFQLQYVIEGAKDIRNLAIPHFTNFRVEEVFDIPNTMAINPQTSQLVHTYTRIVVLTPKRNGRFTLPGATAFLDNKPMRSNPVQVKVQQSGLGSANDDVSTIDIEEESELWPGEDIGAKIRKKFFLRIEANKTSCYIGEPLMVVYKAYSRLNVNSQVVKRPSLTGFSVLEMVDAYDGRPEIEKLDGIAYYVNIIRKVQLFPLQEGNFVLDPAEIESVIHFVKLDEIPAKKNIPGRRFQSIGTGRTPLDYRTILRSEPLAITVKPFPEEQPKDFSGAVGRFSLALRTPANTIHKGDLVKIQLVITGSGNISLLTPPDIQWPAGVDTADPVVKESFNKYIYPLAGSKTFEYSFAAPDTGTYIIPPAYLTYFDPVRKAYQTVASDSVTLHVLATSDNLPAAQTKTVSEEGDTAVPHHLYWFGLIVVLITGWIIYQATRLRSAKKAAALKARTPIFKEPVTATLLTTDMLFTNARQALLKDAHEAFYFEIQQLLWKILASKFYLASANISKKQLAVQLAAKQVPGPVIEKLLAILQECEWALYTPGMSSNNKIMVMQQAEEVAKELLS
jgi:hypothetical protein